MGTIFKNKNASALLLKIAHQKEVYKSVHKKYS
jgi:hypothetical protein